MKSLIHNLRPDGKIRLTANPGTPQESICEIDELRGQIPEARAKIKQTRFEIEQTLEHGGNATGLQTTLAETEQALSDLQNELSIAAASAAGQFALAEGDPTPENIAAWNDAVLEAYN